MDEPTGHPRPKSTLKLLLGGVLFGRQVERILIEGSRDEYTPEGVPPMDERAKALLEAALGLAGDDEWTDDAAVAELRRLAGRHRKALRVAEINSRRGGDYLRYEIENRAQRLLEAAATGAEVRPHSAEERSRFLPYESDDADDA